MTVMSISRSIPVFLALAALALPAVAPAAPVKTIACTVDSTDGTTRQTVSQPRITTRVGRPAAISLRGAAGKGHPAHTLEITFQVGEKALVGESRITIDGQPPKVAAVHIELTGQWVDLDVVGTFKYLVGCAGDAAAPAPQPAPKPSAPGD